MNAVRAASIRGLTAATSKKGGLVLPKGTDLELYIVLEDSQLMCTQQPPRVENETRPHIFWIGMEMRSLC